jgi:hypothetical protein
MSANKVVSHKEWLKAPIVSNGAIGVIGPLKAARASPLGEPGRFCLVYGSCA